MTTVVCHRNQYPYIERFADYGLQLSSGVDFLGWVHFPTHRVLRTATKRRMLRRINEHSGEATVQSYLGLLEHGDTKKLQDVVNLIAWIGMVN